MGFPLKVGFPLKCDRVPSKKREFSQVFLEIPSKLKGITLFLREFKREQRDSLQKRENQGATDTFKPNLLNSNLLFPNIFVSVKFEITIKH